MAQRQVDFNLPTLSAASRRYLLQALESDKFSGDGAFTARATDALQDLTNAGSVNLTTSCTHALEMASLLLNLKPGDEVIVPSFTFVSTASAVAMRGATPVFVDIRPDTLNLDLALVDQAITPRTRAVSALHYGGMTSDIDQLRHLCDERRIVLIEDTAHGVGASYKGQRLGTFGQLGALSFHETKNLQCGEGGALLINDEKYTERAEVIREKGTNRSAFFRGDVDKYTWMDLGSSYLPSDLLAAVLLGAIDAFSNTQARRMFAWDTYQTQLSAWSMQNGIAQPTIPAHSQHPAHLYYLLMPSFEDQQGLLRHLNSNGVKATSHYVPLHTSPAGQRLGRTFGSCDVTTSVSERLVRLPIHPGLSEMDVEYVIEQTKRYKCLPPVNRTMDLARSECDSATV